MPSDPHFPGLATDYRPQPEYRHSTRLGSLAIRLSVAGLSGFLILSRSRDCPDRSLASRFSRSTRGRAQRFSSSGPAGRTLTASPR